MSDRDKEPRPEPHVHVITEEDMAHGPESYAHEDEDEDQDEDEDDYDGDWGGADELETTEEEWAEAAKRQAAMAAADHTYARLFRIFLDSPAVRPANPRLPDDDDEM